MSSESQVPDPAVRSSPYIPAHAYPSLLLSISTASAVMLTAGSLYTFSLFGPQVHSIG